jgi:hypothetical protein
MYTNKRPWIRTPDGAFQPSPNFPRLPATAPRVFVDLLTCCLDQQPPKRPTAADLVTALASMLAAWKAGYDSLVDPHAASRVLQHVPEHAATNDRAAPPPVPRSDLEISSNAALLSKFLEQLSSSSPLGASANSSQQGARGSSQ